MICQTCEGSGFFENLEICPDCQGYGEDPSDMTTWLPIKEVIDRYGHLLSKEELDNLYKLL
jgi:DnaJ-class molecular chaperone